MSTVSSAAAPRLAGLSLGHARVSDELLARYAARGSERAFSLLYERYYQPLYRYCRSIVRDNADAQDALQSTFTRALAALRRDQRNAPLRPWLYRIAHNESITLLRRRKREVEQQSLGEVARHEVPADEAAGARARWNALVEDLSTLPERQRGALLLRELAGLSHEEIGVALGISVGGAKQAIFEARQALAEVEAGRAMSCESVRRQVSEGDRRALRGRRIRAHLRDCAGCGAFALTIDSRRGDLRALAPGLPPAAAAAVLARSLTAASPHGGASAAGGSAVAATAIGKAASSAVAWKALTGAAVLATATAGVSGLTVALRHQGTRPATHTSSGPATPSAHRQPAAVHSFAADRRMRSGPAAAGSHHPRASAPGISPAVAGSVIVAGTGGKGVSHWGAGSRAAHGHARASGTTQGGKSSTSSSRSHGTSGRGHAGGSTGGRPTSSTNGGEAPVAHRPANQSRQNALHTVKPGPGLGSAGTAVGPAAPGVPEAGTATGAPLGQGTRRDRRSSA